jgi:hypothetical protein
MFWSVEARTGLYIFFKTVCDYYGLIPEDNYTIPSEAEGLEPATEIRSSMPPLILKREPSGPGPEDSDNTSIIEGLTDHNLSTAGTTKRHRHSPSVGATAVSTVVEESEEEEDHPKELSRPVTQLFELSPKDDPAADSEEAEESPDEAEAEGEANAEAEADAADAAASSAPISVAAEDEPQKQSASEEAKADPTPPIGEKKADDDKVASSEVDEATSSHVDAADSQDSDAKEAEEESTGGEDESTVEESSSVAADLETKPTDAKSVAKTDDTPAGNDK